MNNKNLAFGVLLIFAVLLMAACTQKVPAKSNDNPTDSMQVNAEVIDHSNLIVKAEGSFEPQGNVFAGTSTPYIEFNQADYDRALAEDKIVVLNFYASWCPTCVAEHEHISAAFRDMENPNVVGFRVNYKDGDTDDAETALAKEFGIAYQHTKVIIKNGERVVKNTEAWEYQRYFDEIKKVEELA